MLFRSDYLNTFVPESYLLCSGGACNNLTQDGVVIYKAQDASTAAGWYGTETFQYEVCDHAEACSQAVITMTVDIPGPAISSVELADPDNLDFVFSKGDTMTIRFSEATNLGKDANIVNGTSATVDKDGVDAIFAMPDSLSNAGNSLSYSGVWKIGRAHV